MRGVSKPNTLPLKYTTLPTRTALAQQSDRTASVTMLLTIPSVLRETRMSALLVRASENYGRSKSRSGRKHRGETGKRETGNARRRRRALTGG